MGHRAVNKNYTSSFFLFLFIILLLMMISVCKSQRQPFACVTANTKNLPFCNVSLPFSSRVMDLIGRLTLWEKIRLLVNNAIAIPRLGIKGYEWWSEALHGVSNTGPGVKFGGDFPGATSFPQVITTAASFNVSMWEAIGQVVSDEARAMYNGGQGGLTYWSPNVNIFRDPRWGRGQETPGEDPLLASWYGASYVRGLQQVNNTDNNNRLKVAACCKHFTAYDLDNWNGTDRFHFNAMVSQQDLEETYNVPFRGCVEFGFVASVMCSYNQVNGIPTCADPNLLRNTIRGQWRLNGYIVSDCDSVGVLFKDQHYTNTPEEAAADTIKAGLDLDCGPFLAIFTEKAIRARLLSEGDVNQALTNLLTVQMRLGMFDGPNQKYDNLGPKDVCTAAHKQLALEAAQQGIVLLQNNLNALPLSTLRHRNVAVIGPNSIATATMIGNYAGIPCNYTNPLQGISKYAKTVNEIGCVNVACTRNNLFGRAEKAARKADATVLVMGLSQEQEREGKDRTNLFLPGYQKELVSRVAVASKGPVILVLMCGGPIDITFAMNDTKIPAILWAGYPGEAGGDAIADVLFGTINPGARLPMTWYPQDYLAKVLMTDMNMHANWSTGYPGRTYRFYDGPTLYRFGFGLSYTTFKHTVADSPTKILVPFTSSKSFNTTTTTTRLSKKGGIRVSDTSCEALNFAVHVDVENIGDMDGTQTVLVYASTSSMAKKKLVGFEKIRVGVGAKERVQINLSPCDHLSVVDKFGIRRIPMGVHNLHIGDHDDLKHTITLYNI